MKMARVTSFESISSHLNINIWIPQSVLSIIILSSKD